MPPTTEGGKTGTDVRVVLVTAPDMDHAERMARTLVEERLAACGSAVPGVASTYRWQGKVERADETLLILKTTADRFEPLRRRVVELHPYEVPEVLGLPVQAGHAPYLAWVAAEVDERT